VATWSASGHREKYSRTLHTVRFPVNAAMLKGMDKKELALQQQQQQETTTANTGYDVAGMVHELHNRRNSATFLLPQSRTTPTLTTITHSSFNIHLSYSKQTIKQSIYMI
jgi:hypothetical protein